MRLQPVLLASLLVACGQSEKQSSEADAQCKADINCIGQVLTTSAEVGLMCGDAVERLSKNDVKWNAQLLQQRFSRATWTNGNKSSVTLIGDQAQFQNDFGANVHMVYQCDVDPAGATVLAVRAVPGQL